jgi:hypothetical protein
MVQIKLDSSVVKKEFAFIGNRMGLFDLEGDALSIVIF